jgi:hypothetical protein
MTSRLSDLVATAWTVVAPLVDDVPDAKDVKPGWIAAVVMIVLFAATILLWFNMRKQLRKITFDPDAGDPGAADPDAGDPR